MTGNLKALGLAFLAIFAIGAVSASAASAADVFTTAASPAWATGTSHDHRFTILAPITTFECTTSKFTGTTTNASNSVTVLPTYTGKVNATPHETPCTASLGTVTIDINDCHYKLTGNTTNEHPKGSGKKDAVIWIECPEGKEIEITGPLGCTIKVPSQTPTEGGVIYTNVPGHPGGAAVKVTATVTGVTYTTTPGCGFVGLPAEGNNAEYKGTVTVTGYEDKGGTFTAPIEGAQKAIEVSGS